MSKRILITVRGHTTPGHITLSGRNDIGVLISEATPPIPVLNENEEFTYVTVHSYNMQCVKHIDYEGLESADIIVTSIDEPMYTEYPQRKSTLTEQDKEALKTMILEAVREVFAERDEAERQQRFNDAW